MRVGRRLAGDADHSSPQYLKPVLVVARSARRGEYVVVHLASGSFFRTDRLGAVVMRALIKGKSSVEAETLVESMEAGAAKRARQLILQLDSQHALTFDRPVQTGSRRFHRSVACVAGVVLTSFGPLVRVAPAGVVAWIFKAWPSTPIAKYVWRYTRGTVIKGLRASGYGLRPQEWLLDVGRRCSAEASRNYLFNYVSVAIPRPRMQRLVKRLFDESSLQKLASCLEQSGPVVGVFLHNPLCVAVPNALRTSGQEVVRVIVSRTHGIYVSEKSGRLGDFFGEPSELAVEESGPDASGILLRHLKAGRSVHLALDKLPGEGKAATVGLLGHDVSRNDGPAWLAVHSKRPLALWTTYNSSTGVVITTSPLLYPDSNLSVQRQVAALSQRLYSYAEAAIREHPEAWTLWTHPGFLDSNLGHENGETTVSKAALVVGR